MSSLAADAQPDDAGNSGGGSDPKRVIGRPFPKGKSGNPSGRPRGMSVSIRKQLGQAAKQIGIESGDGQEVLIAFWTSTMADPAVDRRLRLAASRELADRGWGRAPQFAPIEDENPLEFTDEELERGLDDFAAKMRELRVVDGDARRVIPSPDDPPATNGSAPHSE